MIVFVSRLFVQGKTDLQAIQIIKKLGGNMSDSYLEPGFLLDKKIGVNQPKRIENARVMVANTAMDTDKIKVSTTRGFLLGTISQRAKTELI